MSLDSSPLAYAYERYDESLSVHRTHVDPSLCDSFVLAIDSRL